MDFITNWTERLIIIILIATLLELFLPDNRFQPYIKIVMGLLIILIMLDPLGKLFHLHIQPLNTQKFTGQERPAEKNKIKKLKSEIDQQNAAYIHKQMAVQLEDMVNKEVQDAYGYRITNIDMKTAASNSGKMEHLTVYLSKDKAAASGKNSEISVDPVKAVSITGGGTSQDKSEEMTLNNKQKLELIQLLAGKWDVDPKIIEIKSVKGKSAS